MKDRGKYSSTNWGLLPEESEEQGQDDADDDTGYNGEIEGEPLSLDVDIPRQLPDPGDLIPQGQEQTYDHENHTTDDQDLAYTTEGGHKITLILPRISTE